MAEEKIGPASTRKKCPICGKAATKVDDPFCSRRCADVDLNRWFTGRYAVPVRDDDEDADDSAERGES